MPTDTTAANFDPTPPTDRIVPAGAGLALAVLAGAAIWAGVLAVFIF